MQTAKSIRTNRTTPLLLKKYSSTSTSLSPSLFHSLVLVCSHSYQVGAFFHLVSFRVWNSILHMPCHWPGPGPPDGPSGPGFHSPKALESGGSSPQAPQRHTGRHLWSLHWPLYKGKKDTKIYEISKKPVEHFPKCYKKSQQRYTSALKTKRE